MIHVPSNAESPADQPLPPPDRDGGPVTEFPDVADLSYEDARDELIAIVAQLEAGEAGLEQSMTLWRRGEALATHCSTWLDDAEAALRTDRVDDAAPPPPA